MCLNINLNKYWFKMALSRIVTAFTQPPRQEETHVIVNNNYTSYHTTTPQPDVSPAASEDDVASQGCHFNYAKLLDILVPEVVSKYYEFGIQADLPTGLMDQIKKESNGDYKAAFASMLKHYLIQKNPEPEDIKTILQSGTIELNAFAKHFENVCGTALNVPTTSTHSHSTQGYSPASNYQFSATVTALENLRLENRTLKENQGKLETQCNRLQQEVKEQRRKAEVIQQQCEQQIAEIQGDCQQQLEEVKRNVQEEHYRREAGMCAEFTTLMTTALRQMSGSEMKVDVSSLSGYISTLVEINDYKNIIYKIAQRCERQSTQKHSYFSAYLGHTECTAERFFVKDSAEYKQEVGVKMIKWYLTDGRNDKIPLERYLEFARNCTYTKKD